MTQVSIALTNRRAFFSVGFPYKEFLTEMRYHVPGYQFMPNFRQGWDGYIRLLRKDTQTDRYFCGTGLFLALRAHLEKKYSIEFNVVDLRTPPGFKLGAVISDRDYQRDCLDAMVAASATGGLVVAATGTGKTWIAGTYFSRLVGNACFIVDELQLLEQAREELSNVMGEPVGFVGDMKFAPARATVATIQTLDLHSKDPKFSPWAKSLDVLLIDEIHVMLSKRSSHVVDSIQPRAVFGLTATLELQKKEVRLAAYNLCGPVVYTYPLSEAVEQGNVTDGLVVAAEFTNEKIPTSRYLPPDPAREYRLMISENTARNNYVENLTRAALHTGRSVILMVHRVKHVNDMHYRFHDIPHELMYGGRKAKLRVADTKRFDAGAFKLVIANQVFKKGIDIRSVNTIIDAAASKSPNDAQQKYGRGVRLCEGKDGLLYIDICDRQRKKTDWTGTQRIKNRFADAAVSRIKAFQRLKVKIVRAPETMKPDVVIRMALHYFEKHKKQLALNLKSE